VLTNIQPLKRAAFMQTGSASSQPSNHRPLSTILAAQEREVQQNKADSKQSKAKQSKAQKRHSPKKGKDLLTNPSKFSESIRMQLFNFSGIIYVSYIYTPQTTIIIIPMGWGPGRIVFLRYTAVPPVSLTRMPPFPIPIWVDRDIFYYVHVLL
jgi:hypothetical protein